MKKIAVVLSMTPDELRRAQEALARDGCQSPHDVAASRYADERGHADVDRARQPW